jgi:ATP-dependent DNA ligase
MAVRNQKFDGYRIHARLDRGVRLLTRTGLDWT